MATRKTKALTAALLNSKLALGRYYDGSGSGLHMLVSKTGSKFWVQRYTLHGKRREAGLGSYPTVSLAQAREKAFKNKQLLSDGVDPRFEKAAKKVIPTFSEAVERYLEIRLDAFSNEKHKYQWRSTLQTYANPFIGKLYVNEITNENVLSALKPIWKSKHETAKRLRGRIEKVLAWAKVKGYRSGFNPAAWQDNLSELLPKPSKVQKKNNQPALPLSDVQRWWTELQERDGVGADALQFLTLCASRSGEVRAMVWTEVTLFSKEEAKKADMQVFGLSLPTE